MPKKYSGFFLLLALALAIVAFVSWPHPVSAECGSSASSCKDCHEVKKQAPVNTKGEWHTQHAFGDFCEFCHSGNVKAKDKAAAHVGLANPLADVKASCQSCHPNDYMDRAQKYATALGKPIGSGSAPPGAPAAGGTSTTNGEGCGPAAPSGTGQVIDLNKVYADSKAPPPTNAGNTVLLALIVVTLLALAGLVWHYEKPLERGITAFRQLLATPALGTAMADGGSVEIHETFVGRPELGTLLQQLKSTDSATTRALAHLLSDSENGPKAIKAVGNLDFRALAALGDGDQKALSALLALAREMNS